MGMDEQAVIDTFCEEIGRVFAGYAKDRGFEMTSRLRDRHSFSIVFRNGDRYLRFSGTLHQHDHPYYFSVVMGVGSDEMPESDWNSLAIWRFAEKSGESSREELASLFEIPDQITRDQIREKLQGSMDLVEKYGGSFFDGDLTLFEETRAEVNRARDPYRIYSLADDGTYIREDDSASVKMKGEYS